MQHDDPKPPRQRSFLGRETTSSLAAEAVSAVSRRQGLSASGARQFILDHMLRALRQRGDYSPDQVLDELRGYRLSVDAIIDIYVPAAARILGELWETSEVDFATVTIGTMRLQSLLSVASAESLDFVRETDKLVHLLIVVPMGEQHTLGAFVLAAQLRRLGGRVEMSFCEAHSEIIERVLSHPPDLVLFTAASCATLETIGKIVTNIRKVSVETPRFAVGGHLPELDDVAKDMTGVDLVTRKADVALAFAGTGQSTYPNGSV